ncbi:MAG: hypothetical protein Q3971_09075, partial [Moraxella sp.]|nr:hypothetical protein [Moraxella sp.]
MRYIAIYLTESPLRGNFVKLAPFSTSDVRHVIINPNTANSPKQLLKKRQGNDLTLTDAETNMELLLKDYYLGEPALFVGIGNDFYYHAYEASSSNANTLTLSGTALTKHDDTPLWWVGASTLGAGLTIKNTNNKPNNNYL